MPGVTEVGRHIAVLLMENKRTTVTFAKVSFSIPDFEDLSKGFAHKFHLLNNGLRL